MSLNKKQVEKLESSGYRFVGSHNHAAAKICHWTKQSILDKGVCYKEKFYGIESHRCLQMAPAVPNCQQKCEFCWRDLSYTQTQWEGEYDDPKTIIDEAVKAQNNLLCGFFGNDKANKEKLEESKTPTNAAISLAGEPMLYPEIDELIAEFNRRNFTTFVVSNGQCVDKLKNLENEPYQLYLSLDAPTKKIYNDVCQPQISEGWDNLNQSLDTLASFKMENYTLNLGVARGLDYYTGIVFEVYIPSLGAQKQVCGGGTYSLIKIFGGEEVVSTGFAFGFDRLMNAIEELATPEELPCPIDIYVAPISDDVRLKAYEITQTLRSAGIACDVDLNGKKFKKIMNHANKIKVKQVAIIGAKDLENNQITIKNMESGNQELVDLDNVVEYIKGV